MAKAGEEVSPYVNDDAGVVEAADHPIQEFL